MPSTPQPSISFGFAGSSIAPFAQPSLQTTTVDAQSFSDAASTSTPAAGAGTARDSLISGIASPPRRDRSRTPPGDSTSTSLPLSTSTTVLAGSSLPAASSSINTVPAPSEAVHHSTSSAASASSGPSSSIFMTADDAGATLPTTGVTSPAATADEAALIHHARSDAANVAVADSSSSLFAVEPPRPSIQQQPDTAASVAPLDSSVPDQSEPLPASSASAPLNHGPQASAASQDDPSCGIKDASNFKSQSSAAIPTSPPPSHTQAADATLNSTLDPAPSSAHTGNPPDQNIPNIHPATSEQIVDGLSDGGDPTNSNRRSDVLSSTPDQPIRTSRFADASQPSLPVNSTSNRTDSTADPAKGSSTSLSLNSAATLSTSLLPSTQSSPAVPSPLGSQPISSDAIAAEAASLSDAPALSSTTGMLAEAPRASDKDASPMHESESGQAMDESDGSRNVEPEAPSRSANDRLTSLPLSTAVVSGPTTPSVQSPEQPSTINTLQLASEALFTVREDERDPSAAAEFLSAFQQKAKKVAAVRSPNPGSIRSRSLATTPVPPSLLGVRQDSFNVTANSSRASTPTPRTPSGRSKRKRRERNAATPTAMVSALPSIESNDRRRSARVAKAVTTSASDSPNMPNLALFGFSPYLENLVMNAKETDRRTRSGGRGIRPPVDRAPTRVKRSKGASKNKDKEVDPDGPDDEAKQELYRQLCIISYQLQADLDMVPHRSLDQLREQFETPPVSDKLAPTGTDIAMAGASVNGTRAHTPAVDVRKQEQSSISGMSIASMHSEPIVKIEPPQTPPMSRSEAQHANRPYSPESSPEVALMDAVRPTYNNGHVQYPPYAQNGYQHRHSPDPYSWPAKMDEPEDEPMSPVPRPSRGNIMSISALMSGPSPAKAPRSPTPELIRTPPPPVQHLPPAMQHWTEEDELASQILSACAAAIPQLDTTELDRLTQIAQLAAFDLTMLPSAHPSPEASGRPLEQTESERREAFAKIDPHRLDPLLTLDTAQLYTQEEAEYIEEQEESEELYETLQYLSHFDEVVDEWRAGELARLRLQLEMRKAEVGRIWECDRKLAWSTFIDNRAGELYRKAAAEVSRKKWQAEMELDLLAVHRRKTKGLRKLTEDIWLPEEASAEERELYKRYGRFVSAAKHAGADEPLVRADLRTMRKALREQKHQEEASKHAKATGVQTENIEEAAVDAEDAEIVAVTSTYDSDSDSSYDSDFSSYSGSSGISSLPSFSSVYSTPVLGSIVASPNLAISDLEAPFSDAASLRNVDEDSDDEDADESLWSRQMRLAAATQETAQTPAELLSRVVTPAPAAAEQGGSKKRKRKKPPPPGARLWKKGRVQRDPEPEPEAAENGKVDIQPIQGYPQEQHPLPSQYGYGMQQEPSYKSHFDPYTRDYQHQHGYPPPAFMGYNASNGAGGDVEMGDGRYTPPPPEHMMPHHYPPYARSGPDGYPSHPPPPQPQWPY